MKILVVDDNEMLLRTMQRLLTRCGHEVRTATCVSSGIEAVTLFQPDVIICDYDMPGGTGLDLLGHLWQDTSPAQLTYVLMSGQLEEDIFGQNKRPGALKAFLKKPFSLNELEAVLAA